MHRSRHVVAALALAAAASPTAAAGDTLNVYTDLDAFVQDTCAEGQGPYGPTGQFFGSAFAGELTFDYVAPSFEFFVGDWTELFVGDELSISHVENLSITLAAPATSLGFEIFEPTSPTLPPGCNFPTCLDSTFELTTTLGGTPVETTTFNVTDDVAAFFGVQSSVAFDGVEIRELTADIGNEYFGQFYVGRGSPAFVYGPPAAGTGGFVPLLPPPSPPLALGGSTTLVASDLLGGAPTLLAIGVEPQDAFVKGIHLLVLPEFYLPVPVGGAPGVAGSGGFSLPLNAPNDPLFVDLTIYLQVIVQDDGGPSSGYAASSGLALTICP